MLLSTSFLISALVANPVLSLPSSAYTFSPYPSSTASPFTPPNLTSSTQPSSPNNFTTDEPYLEVVHEIYNLTTFPTGVAVDLDNRIFINFPRSASNNDVTLGLADSFNTTVAYPNASIQTCQPGQNVSTCFVNIQSVVIDSSQRIWALDTGAGPAQTNAVEYGAKIMSFNLTTNEMIDNYVLPYSISANGTRYAYSKPVHFEQVLTCVQHQRRPLQPLHVYRRRRLSHGRTRQSNNNRPRLPHLHTPPLQYLCSRSRRAFRRLI